MIPRETCSSYSSLQRTSKINYIIYESKDRSTVDHSAPVFFTMGFSLLSASEFLQTEKWRCAKQ